MRAAQADDPNETLFLLGTSVLDALVGWRWTSTAWRIFEYRLLRLQGVYPPYQGRHRCSRRFTGEGEDGAWLSPLDSVLTCATCADGLAGHRLGTSLSPGALAFLAPRTGARAARSGGLVEGRGRAGRAGNAAPRADGAAPRTGIAVASCVASDQTRAGLGARYAERRRARGM